MQDIDLQRFDLNLLVVFDALMRERHVGRAGERLGLTQPAVSHALGRLRVLLDDPLFVKHAKGMHPTARALALADETGPALRALRSAMVRDLTFNPAGVRRKIVIGTSDYISLVLMPTLMARLGVEAPAFDIHIRPTTRETVIQDLRRQEIDLVVGPLAAGTDEIRATPLFTEQLVLVARRDHPVLAEKLTLPSIVGYSHLLVSLSGDPLGSVDKALREAGVTRRVAMTLPHFLAAPFILETSDLLAFLPERLAKRLSGAANLSIHPFPAAVPAWGVGLGRLKDAAFDPAVEWLADLVGEIARDI
jgi:DNA-binding transcriptional LysR family regulator